MNVNVEVDDQIVMQHLENMTDRLRTQLEVLGNATGQKIQQSFSIVLTSNPTE